MTTEQHGIADISQTLYDRVTKYHAQIGHAVPKDTLQSLEWNLLAGVNRRSSTRRTTRARSTRSRTASR